MDERGVVKTELARLMAVLSHPLRIRIVEELRDGEKDVSSLQSALGVSQSVASQHLATLRTNRMVAERRDGRHVYYRLLRPGIFGWLLGGLMFVESDRPGLEASRHAIERARELWAEPAASAD